MQIFPIQLGGKIKYLFEIEYYFQEYKESPEIAVFSVMGFPSLEDTIHIFKREYPEIESILKVKRKGTWHSLKNCYN